MTIRLRSPTCRCWPDRKGSDRCGRFEAGAVDVFKAKDILRACGLPLLPPENPHVAADLVNIADGAPLSPCLLVRGALSRGRPAQIADGYHRVCASYHTDENTDIPVKIATL